MTTPDPITGPYRATLEARPVPELAVVRLIGTNMPDGLATVTRTDSNGTMLVRGAVSYHIDNGAFVIDDAEAPFDQRLTYHVSITVDDALIEANMVLNPSAETNTASWIYYGQRTAPTRVAAATTPQRPAIAGSYFFTVDAPRNIPTAVDAVVGTTPQQLLPGDYWATGWARIRPGQGVDEPGLMNYSIDPNLRTPANWAMSGTAAESRLDWVPGGGVVLNNLRPSVGQNWAATRVTYDSWNDAVARARTWEGLMGTGPGLTPIEAVLLSAPITAPARVDATLTVALRVAIGSTLIVTLIDNTTGAPVASEIVNSTADVQLIPLLWPASSATVRVGVAPARRQSQRIDQIGFYLEPVTADQNVPFSGDDPGYFWTGTPNSSTSALYRKVVAHARWAILDAAAVHIAEGELFEVSEEMVELPTGPLTVSQTVQGSLSLVVEDGAGRRAWDFDAVRLDVNRPKYEWSINYFDGSSALPALAPAGSVMRWTGAAHASRSEYVGPAALTFDIGPVTLTQAVALDHCGSAQVHLSDPVAPLYGAYFTLLTFPKLNFAGRNSEAEIIGRPAPMYVSDVRKAPSGEITLLTYTLAERDRLRLLLESGRTLILRMPPEFGDPVLYVIADAVDEERVLQDHRRAERRWLIPIQVVDRPGGLVDTGLSNWRSVVDNNATWRDVKTTYASWIDLVLGATGGLPPARTALVTGWGSRTVPSGGAWYASGYRGIPAHTTVKDRDRAVGI